MLSNVKKKHKKSLCTLFYIFFVAEKSIFGLAAKKAIKARCYSDKLVIPLRRALNKSCFQNRPTWVWKVRFRICLRWKYVWGKFEAWRCHVFLFSGQGGTVSCASQCASQCVRSKSLQAMENLLTKLWKESVNSMGHSHAWALCLETKHVCQKILLAVQNSRSTEKMTYLFFYLKKNCDLFVDLLPP